MGARDVFIDLVDADALVASILREFAAPPPRISVTEWAEANRVLSGKDSSEPGPYRVSRTPYAAQPQNDLSPYVPVEEVVLMWAAQTSKTTVLLNWLGSTLDNNPGPMMVVQPTIDMGKRFSRQRLTPMVDESPALRHKVKENRSRDDANTTLLKETPGGFVAIAGANSAAGLRSMPVRDLLLDEIDGYPLDVDGEGDPCQLAEARQSTFSRRKRLKTSTPTVKGLSRIEAAFQASDRNYYHVACPHCGSFQRLIWGNDKDFGLKWHRNADGSPVPGSTRYVCETGGCEILEHHKPAMLAGGQWIAENPGAARGKVRGYHLSGLYSPLGWLSWEVLAKEWHAAIAAHREGDSSLLRTFVNTRLAETYADQGDNADASALARRAAAGHQYGTVPWGGLIVTAGADVQGDRLEARSWACGRGGERWLVAREIFIGDPALPEDDQASPWRRLTAWFRTPIQHASGATLRIRAMAVDTGGHHTQAVYTYCRRHAYENVLAIKGAAQSGRPLLGKPSDAEINHQGRRLKKGVKLWPIGTDTAKELIYSRLRIEQAGPGHVHLPRDLPGDEIDQLTAETRVPRYRKGHVRYEWVKPNSRRNEALDCAVYAEAAAHYLGIHRYTEVHWQRLEAQVRQVELIAAASGEEEHEEPGNGDASLPESPSHLLEEIAAASLIQPEQKRVAQRPRRRSFVKNW